MLSTRSSEAQPKSRTSSRRLIFVQDPTEWVPVRNTYAMNLGRPEWSVGDATPARLTNWATGWLDDLEKLGRWSYAGVDRLDRSQTSVLLEMMILVLNSKAEIQWRVSVVAHDAVFQPEQSIWSCLGAAASSHTLDAVPLPLPSLPSLQCSLRATLGGAP